MSLRSSVIAISIADTPSIFGILASALYVSKTFTRLTLRYATAICIGVFPWLSFIFGDALYLSRSLTFGILFTSTAK